MYIIVRIQKETFRSIKPSALTHQSIAISHLLYSRIGCAFFLWEKSIRTKNMVIAKKGLIKKLLTGMQTTS